MLDKMQAQMNARYAVNAGGYLAYCHYNATDQAEYRRKATNARRNNEDTSRRRSTTIFVVTGGSISSHK